MFKQKKNNKIWIVFCIFLTLFFVGRSASPTLASWGYMDNITQGSENITDSANNHDDAVLRIYNDKPRLAWIDETTGEVYYTQWSGSSWTYADGSTSGYENISNLGAGKSYNMRMEIDSNGYPRIVFDEAVSNDYIYYIQWSGSSWTHADGSTAGKEIIVSDKDASNALALALDDNDKPHVAWSYEVVDFEIYYTKWNGSGWTYADSTTNGYEQVSDLPDTIEQYPTLKIYNNNPRIISGAFDNGYQIQYIQWSGSSWTHADGSTAGWENIADPNSESNSPQMELASNGYPRVIWVDAISPSDFDIYYSQWSGSAWTYADGTTTGYENVHDNDKLSYLSPRQTAMEGSNIALDQNDRPMIVWRNDADGNFDIYFTKWSGSAWTKADGTAGYDNLSDSTTFNYIPRIELDSVDNPVVSWSHNASGNSDIYYTQWTPGAGETVCGSGITDCWTTAEETVSGVDNVSNNSGDSIIDDMALNSVNAAYFVWHDDTDGNYDIYFSRWLYDQEDQVNITADVEPSLTFNISSAICNLGTFSASTIKTCNYYTEVDTNASGGYIAYIKEDGNLRNATNSINDVTDNEVTAGSEEYGVATSDSDYASLDINQQVTDCASLDGSSTASASTLTTSDQLFAIANQPVSSDTVHLCFSAAISGDTPAGAYSNTVTITVIGNF